jgi:hypothetical protein
VHPPCGGASSIGTAIDALPGSEARLHPPSQLGVERLAQAVSDHVEAEHRDHDRDPGDDRQERAACTITGEIAFGRMCEARIVGRPTSTDRAASTKY